MSCCPIAPLHAALLLATCLVPPLAMAQPDGSAVEASELYTTVCARCHETRVGPTLLGRALPAAVVQTIVRSGLNGMPAFRPSEISHRELEALARYIEAKGATK